MNVYEFSLHARQTLAKRVISDEWVHKTLEHPDRILLNADADNNTHFLKQIESFGNRWLRVVVNTEKDPPYIITAFFDRRIR